MISIFAMYGQTKEIANAKFRPPVDIPIYLSGTFGELRTNHFHAGIDIKTQGVEGKKVIAIADGYVSRIKISEGGYGRAIYITHPNGFVSVYGHLKKFNDKIQKIVVDKQYQKESFFIQIYPKKNEITVKKGEVIAFSGNTGGSEGPHLHFEIREEKSQHPVNPLLNKNIKIKDYYRPKISKLAIYPVDINSAIDGKNDTLFFDVAGWGSNHKLSNKKEITVSGRISFGVSAVDLMNDIPNKNGVYSIKLYYDSDLVYYLIMNNLSFNTSRYINSLIDYSYFIKTNKRIVRTEVDTNNLLDNYVEVKNNGIIEFNDTLTHQLKYEIKDAYGNTSILKFSVTSNIENANIDSTNNHHQGKFFTFRTKNIIEDDSLIVSFPSNSFYQSYYFNFNKIKRDSNSYSEIYKLHDKFTPVQKYFTIKIIPDSVAHGFESKMYIAYSTNNADYSYSGSIKDGNYITSKSRNLGYYKIMIDTIPPEIQEVNFTDGKNISKQHTLKIKISDEQTGIKNYRATLNNKWILMEYDSKKNLLFYNYDDRLTKGKNNYNLIVSDLVGNISEYDCVLVY